MRCAHTSTMKILGYVKCSGCGEVWALNTYNPDCPDCEFETHRCGHCGETLDHTEYHKCPRAYGA